MTTPVKKDDMHKVSPEKTPRSSADKLAQVPGGMEYVQLGSVVPSFRGAETEQESRELRDSIRRALLDVFADFYEANTEAPTAVEANTAQSPASS